MAVCVDFDVSAGVDGTLADGSAGVFAAPPLLDSPPPLLDSPAFPSDPFESLGSDFFGAGDEYASAYQPPPLRINVPPLMSRCAVFSSHFVHVSKAGSVIFWISSQRWPQEVQPYSYVGMTKAPVMPRRRDCQPLRAGGLGSAEVLFHGPRSTKGSASPISAASSPRF